MYKDESNLYIFLELVTKGTLLSLYQKYILQDSVVSSYTRQILHGLKYLHERNVVHRDIKCANILVHANGSAKLADFGLTKVTKLNDIKSFKGTLYWMAPEVVKLNDQEYGLPADIWSLGCTVLEMLTRQIPYANLELMRALFQIGRGVPPPVPDSLSSDARISSLDAYKLTLMIVPLLLISWIIHMLEATAFLRLIISIQFWLMGLIAHMNYKVLKIMEVFKISLYVLGIVIKESLAVSVHHISLGIFVLE
ncbi:Mitogen-activated protein kinase kinase kinase 1 [Camellia lanceoleosa]|nr:Mitogen-activated protein kinase kinase kinase 1 [Camellia lanceoleosa]